jgi:hypothetical protein
MIFYMYDFYDCEVFVFTHIEVSYDVCWMHSCNFGEHIPYQDIEGETDVRVDSTLSGQDFDFEKL